MNGVLWFVLGLILVEVRGLCPGECLCSLDERGRRQVLCSRGGLVDPIPIINMNHDVEVLKISAPADAPNFLTIGPIFQGLSRLEELHIVVSNIPAIGRHSFWGISNLLVLNLTRNNISHILKNNFKGLVKLLRLHLDNNRIESMPSESFRHVQELRVLTLSGNKIHQLVPRIFLMLGKLQELDLSRNPLSELNPEVFRDVLNLNVFRCRSCNLSTANGHVFKLFVDLTELDLGDNELRYLQDGELSSLKKLRILRLDGNKLAALAHGPFVFGLDTSDGTAFGPSNLHVIDLSRNLIKEIASPIFANSTTLRFIDLSYNKLDKLDWSALNSIGKSLETLNLSGNAVTLEFPLGDLLNLRHLSLADMNMTVLSLELFAHHHRLEFLNLSGNYFAHLSPHFASLVSRIQILDLSRNRLRGLSEKVIANFEKVANLILTGNPWACDLCHIPSILNRMNKSGIGSALKDLLCKSPLALAGRSVSSLQGNELRWCAVSEMLPVDEAAGVIGIQRSFLSARAEMSLFLGLVFLALFLVSGIIAVACLAHSHRPADHYYTGEEDRNSSESALENSTVGIAGSPEAKTKKKSVSIATIEEISKYPELQVLTNGI